jgi:hypothetical protein
MKKTIPSFCLLDTAEHAIPADGRRAMTARQGAHGVEIASRHAARPSHPGAVIRLIETTPRSTVR